MDTWVLLSIWQPKLRRLPKLRSLILLQVRNWFSPATGISSCLENSKDQPLRTRSHWEEGLPKWPMMMKRPALMSTWTRLCKDSSASTKSLFLTTLRMRILTRMTLMTLVKTMTSQKTQKSKSFCLKCRLSIATFPMLASGR